MKIVIETWPYETDTWELLQAYRDQPLVQKLIQALATYAAASPQSIAMEALREAVRARAGGMVRLSDSSDADVQAAQQASKEGTK